MKRMFIILGAAALLAGCSADTYPDSSPETTTAETPAATEATAEDMPAVWDSAYPDTAVKLVYALHGESSEEYTTENKAVIEECISALKQIKVTEQTDTRYKDFGTVLTFEFEDGKTCSVKFENKNLIYNGKAYTTENSKALFEVLDKIKGE